MENKDVAATTVVIVTLVSELTVVAGNITTKPRTHVFQR